MATEIERKFLAAGDGWRDAAISVKAIRQGYIAQGATASVRVRVTDNAAATLTIKAERSGPARLEFEYVIPVPDAEALLALAGAHILAKRRHIVPAAEHDLVWEVDVFEGRHAGLVLAEIELDQPGRAVVLPDWIGREVTDDPRYYNEALATADGMADTPLA